MAARTKIEINLLPEKGFSTTTSGRILAWLLSSFRIIVIVTEVIVMVSFLSRFWLDAQNTDLNDEMKTKQAVLQASEDFERDFKETQLRIKVFSELYSEQDIYSNSRNTLTPLLPPDIFLTSIVFKSGKMTVQGLTASERSIQQLLVNIDESDIFVGAELISMSTNSDDPSLLTFEIETTIKLLNSTADVKAEDKELDG